MAFSGVSVGSGTAHIFVGNLDSGTEYTLSRFANDNKMCGAVSTLEGKDLDRLESGSTKVSKAKCKVLHLVQGNPKNMEGVHGREVGTT